MWAENDGRTAPTQITEETNKTPTHSQPSCDGAADRNPTVKGSTEQTCLCWNCSCWPHCFSLNALVVCEDADHHTEKKCVKLRL